MSEPAGSRVTTARRRAIEAEARVVKWKILAAQRRAIEAEARVINATKEGIKWKILRFFAQPTIAAWTALFYVLISFVGVIYSWAFYLRFNDIHIFDFFNTPDFLLSAFQDIGTLLVGVGATLVGIGILVYRIYNSSIYSAYKSDGNRYRSEQRSRIKREAILLLSIALLLIFLISIFFFPWDWSEPSRSYLINAWQALWRLPILGKSDDLPIYEITSIIVVLLNLTILIISVSLTFGRLFRSLIKDDQESPIIRRFLGDDRESQIKKGSRFLALILLVEGIFILPFLSGVYDSKAALAKESRHVKVTLRQGAAQHQISSPARTLLLGTTSGFHFLYECEEPKTAQTAESGSGNGNGSTDEDDSNGETFREDWKCGEGRPFIIPTASIASLESNPQKGGNGPGSVSGVVSAINNLNKSSKANADKITGAINGLRLRVVPDPDSGLCTSGWKRVETVGTFCEGKHDQLEKNKQKTAEKCPSYLVTLDKLVTKMNGDSTNRQTLKQLLLIGRADIKPLRWKRRVLYGSNNGLAQARAKWVLDQMTAKSLIQESDRERAILLSAGPLHVGSNVSDCDLSLDRSVEVWACWAPKEPSASDSTE